MDSIGNFYERFEALKQQTEQLLGTWKVSRRYLPAMIWALLLLYLAVLTCAAQAPAPPENQQPAEQQSSNLEQQINGIKASFEKMANDIKYSLEQVAVIAGETNKNINNSIENLNESIQGLNSGKFRPFIIAAIPLIGAFFIGFVAWKQLKAFGEQIGISNEQARISNEQARISNEQARISNEQLGVQLYERAITEINTYLNIFIVNPDIRPYFYKFNGKYEDIQKNDALYNKVLIVTELMLNTFASMLTHAVLSKEYPIAGVKEIIKYHMKCPTLERFLLNNFHQYQITGLSLLLLRYDEDIPQTKDALNSIISDDLAQDEKERRTHLLARLDKPGGYLLFTKEGMDRARDELQNGLRL
jgi:hypothetical protein